MYSQICSTCKEPWGHCRCWPIRSSDATLVAALRILANDIRSNDGVANACIAEAANRIEELALLVGKNV